MWEVEALPRSRRGRGEIAKHAKRAPGCQRSSPGPGAAGDEIREGRWIVWRRNGAMRYGASEDRTSMRGFAAPVVGLTAVIAHRRSDRRGPTIPRLSTADLARGRGVCGGVDRTGRCRFGTVAGECSPVRHAEGGGAVRPERRGSPSFASAARSSSPCWSPVRCSELRRRRTIVSSRPGGSRRFCD